jgi:hypothetical protein
MPHAAQIPVVETVDGPDPESQTTVATAVRGIYIS